MNRDEARQILMLYRPGTADVDDPQVAEALTCASRDAELGDWLEQHRRQQTRLREKFRQIPVPAGLKEQIISEEAARKRRMILTPPRLVFAAALGVALLGFLALVWKVQSPPDDTLPVFQNRMAGIALRGYAMDLQTNSPEPIRAYLARNSAPADFILPAALQKAAITGCAVEGWQATKVSMICFRTGKPLAPGGQSDLWLFVVDRASMRDTPEMAAPQISRVNRLITATWTQGDKLYLLGTVGDERTIREFL